MAFDKDFQDSIQSVKIPVLVLDQKWHRLFVLGGKPEEVLELEKEENNLLKRQAELNKELKDLKKVKENLMKSVMTNMEGTNAGTADLLSKKLDEDKRLLDECKERIEADEDELLDLPHKLDETNKSLMIYTMNFCYNKLRINSTEADEITEWIKNMRVELKKNVIRKQNREINNKEIYSYMHDVFGKDVLDLFDVKYEDFDLGIKDDHPDESNAENKQVSNDNNDKKD